MKDYWGTFAEDANPNQRGQPHWPSCTSTHKTLVLRPDGPRVSTPIGADHHCDFWADPTLHPEYGA
jgi:hypothetical protein